MQDECVRYDHQGTPATSNRQGSRDAGARSVVASESALSRRIPAVPSPSRCLHKLKVSIKNDAAPRDEGRHDADEDGSGAHVFGAAGQLVMLGAITFDDGLDRGVEQFQ